MKMKYIPCLVAIGFNLTLLLLPVSARAQEQKGFIKNVTTNMCLTIPESTEEIVVNAEVRTCSRSRRISNADRQIFDVVVIGDNLSVRTLDGSKCLNLKASIDNREGGVVKFTGCSSHPDQLWTLVGADAGSSTQLRNVSSGKCLNVHAGLENREGGRVTVYSCANTDDQRWNLAKQGPLGMPRRNIGFPRNELTANDSSSHGTDSSAATVNTKPVIRERIKLPLRDQREEIAYKIIDGLPIFQGDIILDGLGGIDVEPPEPHPVRRTFSEFGVIAPGGGVAHRSDPLLVRESDGVIDRNWLWSRGIIPYSFEGGDFSTSERDAILAAIADLNTNTNLNIVPKWKVQNHVHFIKNNSINGGLSKVGRSRIYQRIKLGGGGTTNQSVIQHELLHAAGFWHEQARRDRDRFIRINFDNIVDSEKSNFEMHESDAVQVTPYDITSIMHYGGFAFSKNGQPTIVRVSDGAPVPRSSELSPTDIDGVNFLYPYDYYEERARPISTLRTLKVQINRVQSNDRDGGAKHDIDFYMKSEIGGGWDWRPGARSNPTERRKSGTVEEDDNDIFPSWEFRHLLSAGDPFAKVYLMLRDDDGLSRNERTDETVDINPFPTIKAIELYVDTASGDIFLGDIDGVQRGENYLGGLGERISLEGFEGDIKAFVELQITIE